MAAMLPAERRRDVVPVWTGRLRNSTYYAWRCRGEFGLLESAELFRIMKLPGGVRVRGGGRT
ncbi:hypothetical protein [Plantactinospora endophytica]|uniref:Uncharacterized protein n=1 Tax=Plantactinospora endophytica TaxID=673535 RepID=A0ABQ4E6G7_9ACTN|nr:hypothetical protein [Plantactinospora endophytica]GIG90291.1 hypothetical protein Pen02_52270 [Plantactinospora endophytica]